MALKLISHTFSNESKTTPTSSPRESIPETLFTRHQPDICFLHGKGHKRDIEKSCADKDYHVVIRSDGLSFSGLGIRKTCTRIATKPDMCSSSILHRIRYKYPSNKTDIREITALVVTINHMDILLVSWSCMSKGPEVEIQLYFCDMMEFLQRILEEIEVPRLIVSVCCSLSPSEAQTLTDYIVYDIDQTNSGEEIDLYNYFITIHPSVTLLGVLKEHFLSGLSSSDSCEDSEQFTEKCSNENRDQSSVIAYINPTPYIQDDIGLEDVYSIWMCALIFWQTWMDKFLYEVQYIQATFTYHMNVTTKPSITEWYMTLHGEIVTFWEEWLSLQESWQTFYEGSLKILQSVVTKETRPIVGECQGLCKDWLPRIGKFQEKLNTLYAVAAEFTKLSSLHHITFFTGVDKEEYEELVHRGYDRAYKLFQKFILLNKDKNKLRNWITSFLTESESMCNEPNIVLLQDHLCDQMREWPTFCNQLSSLCSQTKTQFRYRNSNSLQKRNTPALKGKNSRKQCQ